jgi:hypothetical protein
MSHPNQDYTIHQLHAGQFTPGCEWCEHEKQVRNRKRFDIEGMGARLRKAANSIDRVGRAVKLIQEAEKNNPNHLIF